MKIRKIAIKNFGQYKDVTVNFSEQNLIGLSGRDVLTGKSIGSGKSTFLESILYALYGRYRGGDVINAVRTGQRQCEVSVVFIMNGIEYTVTRKTEIAKNNKGKTSLIVKSGEGVLNKGVTDGSQYIENIIGCNYDLFTAISFFVQDKADDFINATPSKKLEYLQTLCELTIFEDARKKVVSDIAEITREREKKQAVYDHINGEIDWSLIEVDVDVLKKKANTLNEELALAREASKRQDEIEKGNAEYEQISWQIGFAGDSIGEIKHDIESLKMPVCAVTNEEYSDADKIIQFLTDANKNLESHKEYLYSEKARINQQISLKRSLESQILQAQKESFCPVCKRPFEDDSKEQHVKVLQEEYNSIDIEDINTIDKAIQKVIADIQTNNSAISENMQKKTEYESFSRVQRVYEDRLDGLQRSLESRQKEQSELIEKQKGMQFFDYKYTNYNNLLADIQNKINEIDKSIQIFTENEQKRAKLLSMESEVKELSRKEGDLTIIATSFSKNEIPKKIMQAMIDQIEFDSNQILSELLQDHSLRFETVQTSKTGNVSGTLQIIVNAGEFEREFSSFSGGERTLINFSLRLAISRYLTRRSGKQIGIVILDEVFSALDEQSLQGIMKALTVMARDFSQIFNITHDPIVEDIFPYMLNVRSEKNVSTILWGK